MYLFYILAVNLDCLDKAMTFTFGGKMYPSCAKFISRNKCECDEHRDNCCASCEDIGKFIVNMFSQTCTIDQRYTLY